MTHQAYAPQVISSNTGFRRADRIADAEVVEGHVRQGAASYGRRLHSALDL